MPLEKRAKAKETTSAAFDGVDNLNHPHSMMSTTTPASVLVTDPIMAEAAEYCLQTLDAISDSASASRNSSLYTSRFGSIGSGVHTNPLSAEELKEHADCMFPYEPQSHELYVLAGMGILPFALVFLVLFVILLQPLEE